jgi:hypothetical protein
MAKQAVFMERFIIIHPILIQFDIETSIIMFFYLPLVNLKCFTGILDPDIFDIREHIEVKIKGISHSPTQVRHKLR